MGKKNDQPQLAGQPFIKRPSTVWNKNFNCWSASGELEKSNETFGDTLELQDHQQILGALFGDTLFQDFCWTCKKQHGTNAILWHCSVFYGETTRCVPTRYPPVQPKKRNVWQLRVAKGLDDWNKFEEPVFPLGSDEFLINLPFHKHLQRLRTIHNVIVKW